MFSVLEHKNVLYRQSAILDLIRKWAAHYGPKLTDK